MTRIRYLLLLDIDARYYSGALMMLWTQIMCSRAVLHSVCMCSTTEQQVARGGGDAGCYTERPGNLNRFEVFSGRIAWKLWSLNKRQLAPCAVLAGIGVHDTQCFYIVMSG